MFSYATISEMIKYGGINGSSPPSTKGYLISEKVKSILKIIFGHGLVRYYSGKSNSGYFLHNTRGWEYPWVIEQVQSLEPGSKILDCGCGVSSFPLELHNNGYDVSGLDKFLEENFLTLLFGRYAGPIGLKFFGKGPGWGIPRKLRKQRDGKVKYFDGSIHNIPVADETFDAVTCLSVMEHIVLSTGDDHRYHFKCLDEMKRVLRPNGLLICTYDTVLVDSVRFWAGKEGWGEKGWHYLTDIEYLDMTLKDPNLSIPSKEEISNNPDTYFIAPEVYYDGYGSKMYERITSVGFVLVKK